VEVAFWDTVKDSTEPVELEAYLEQYPEGSFVELANARLRSLREGVLQKKEEAPSPREQVAVELTFWETVTKDDTMAMYEAYLEKYPEGEFASLAIVRLDELKAGAPRGNPLQKNS